MVQGKITEADTPTIQLGATPPGLISDPPAIKNKTKLECGPMPNVMVALPNIGGALCSTPQSLADDHY